MLGKVLVLVGGLALSAAANDAIYFERDFPGAVPARFDVSLDERGLAVYREVDEEPVELAVGAREAAKVFRRAAELKYFGFEVASRRKVASTGRKLLRYLADGEVRGEVRFDYSEQPAAREIASWFVKLAATVRHLHELERTYRFDRLGVNQALERLEESHDRNRVVAAQLLVPILRQIAQQPRIVHLARARAEGLLERIRSESE